MINILKIMGIVLIVLCVIGGIRYLAERSYARYFIRKHNIQRQECQKEKEKLDE